MPDYPLIPAFHFRVTFPGQPFGQNESSFQSVGGLEVSLDTENVREGGENRFEYALPTKTSFSTLSLNRGLLQGSDLVVWVKRAIQNLDIEPLDMQVSLLDETHAPLMTWDVKHAWPKKWSVSEFNADNSALVIETLELQYLYFTQS